MTTVPAIWSTRFKEHVRTKSQGGKATAGQKVREYSYTISFAVGLCEGPIDRIGRIWADGKLLATEELEIRTYPGDELQLPDPKIEAVEGAGNVPVYRRADDPIRSHLRLDLGYAPVARLPCTDEHLVGRSGAPIGTLDHGASQLQRLGRGCGRDLPASGA